MLSNLSIYIVWISTQILTSVLNRHLDTLFSDSDKHIDKNNTFRKVYDYLQTNQHSISKQTGSQTILCSGLYNRLVKHTSDLLFFNDSTFATNGKTMDSDTQKISENG